ncbi:MAG: iron-siderophore ABC transporter substrate-binding protein [Propionicimonas sp.]|uniref:iron-siderophore ABC transporter substrate-binding protein n=1 Tax=Propionicimonas sp. TaxID=1955623 RepID=UPI002B1EFCCF|nr:iron-siderophore ABC transporter substrate-binding protein [Propionicimonas sp.]MEA4945178.1 iron-siderophore ABC transporter substrate-binding protein [Propionicimonas sp.]
MRMPRIPGALAAVVAATLLTACSSGAPASPAASSAAPSTAATSVTPSSQAYPITIEHAFGETTIAAKPERVATVAWANHEVPLSLGVVPVGMAAANFADPDGDGLLPWVKDKLDELGAATPVLFDESDGIDFEAVADTKPDVILAAYSGLTQEDYDTLTKIAPTVAFPATPWTTSWREMITLNSTGMGMADEGNALITELEGKIRAAADANPVLAQTSVMFLTHVDVTDLSVVNFYTPADTRVQFFTDLGMKTPASIAAFQPDPANPFAGQVSAENADTFNDVDLIVTYGDQAMIDTLKADPLLGLMPAIKNDAVVLLDGASANATAANPTPLQLPYLLDWYVGQLVTAAEKSK